MKTEKEKAIELFDKFNRIKMSVSTQMQKERAKKCALLSVDEMIYENNLHLCSFGHERIIFLKEVKREIEYL